ncbi:MAG: hypothetical protein OXG46_09695 [Chloroflexi bacterium]|nr:hypothetical protein [Chloroflexota bacterium]MCY3939020.1 hypothetical protein [Chloroflexota bacterium]
MAIDRGRMYREMAARGKYRRLYTHLRGLGTQEWRTSFGEIESILGFELPASARLYRPWWANQTAGNGHSQALAWGMAGWETAQVDLEAETLLLRRRRTEAACKVSLDDVWPAHPTAVWPEGLSLRREDIYEDRV